MGFKLPHVVVKAIGIDNARLRVHRAGATAAVQIVRTLVRPSAGTHGGGDNVYIVRIGVGGHAHGVDEIRIHQVHLRVLLEHFLHQPAMPAQFPI